MVRSASARATRSTSATTTRSGGGRCATSAGCTRSSASRRSSAAWRGSRSCASATAFRAAFAGFDPEAVAAFGKRDVDRLLADAGIVRNRLKIEATIANAQATRRAARRAATRCPSSSGRTRRRGRGRRRARWADVAALTPESTALAKELKRNGFRFVGPTTAYALMQACGLVNDHLAGCRVRADVERARTAA